MFLENQMVSYMRLQPGLNFQLTHFFYKYVMPPASDSIYKMPDSSKILLLDVKMLCLGLNDENYISICGL